MNPADRTSTPPAEGSRGAVRDAVRTFVTQTFYVADEAHLDDETSLIEKGIIDSTGVLELLAFIEQKFGIEPTDAEIVPENFDGIGPLTRFVERKLGG